MLTYLFTKTPLVFFTQNLWRDEAFSFLLAQEPIERIISLTAADFNPPLYYLILHVWIQLFGSSEIAIRSLSFIFFAGIIFLVYYICAQVFHLKKLGTSIMLLIFSMNPFLISYAFEARMYIMAAFFVTLSYYALWSKKHKLYILATTLALYTHYLTSLVIIAQFLPDLVRMIATLKNNTWEKHLKHFLMPAISVLLFAPWFVYMLIKHDFGQNYFWIITPQLYDVWYIPFILYTAYERVFGQYYHGQAGYVSFHSQLLILLYGVLLIPIIMKFATFKQTIRMRHERLSLYRDLLLWAALPAGILFILSFLTAPLYIPRYVIFSVPGFLFLLGLFISSLLRDRKNWLHVLTGAMLLVILFAWTNDFNELNLRYRSKRLISPLIAEIQAQMKPQDYLYVTSELDYHLVQYYMGNNKNRVRIYGKSYSEIPSYVGKALIPSSQVTNTLPIFPNKAFVLGYNSYEIMTAK